ncbi:pol polyprotein [Tanacetum coccineum]
MQDHDSPRLWESLERKYKTEDAGTKKFVVARFLDYKMVDSKSVVSQVQDLQVLLHDIHAEGMTLSETFQVAAIIEKYPKADKKKNDKKGKGKSEYLAPKAGIVKQKFQGTCYNCDQPGHRAANCKMPKRVNPRQANMVDENVDMIAMVSDVCAMISEVNLVGTNNSGWWIDTGATRHVCADKSMFHSFRAVDNGQKLYMGNSATADIKGEGDVILKMTSEKELKLTNDMWCGSHSMTATYLFNKIPRKKRNRLLMNMDWKKTIISILYSVGLFSQVAVPPPKAQMIGPKSVDCIFIGYAKKSTAYRFIVHESKNPDIQKNTIMESRNASFFENIFPCLSKGTGSSSRLDDKVVQDKEK